MEGQHECPECGLKFGVKSNLTRHRKIHEERGYKCEQCGSRFTLKQHLDRHAKLHFYPTIPLHRDGEAQLRNTSEGDRVWRMEEKEKVVDKVWRDPRTAEAEAKKCGHELWRGQIVLTFGKCAGQTFHWLLENAVGYTLWLVDQFIQHGESNPILLWQKQHLLELVKAFPILVKELERRKLVRLYDLIIYAVIYTN